jgi:hypothetical protein
MGLLLLLNCFALWNFLLLSRDLVNGDRSADELLVHPIYRPLRVPARPITEARQGVGRVGSDFAQVYFPALDIPHLQNAFDAGLTLDPWKRPSRYAPLVELACAATLCNLDFGIACLLHILVQLLLLYAVLYWMFRDLRLQQFFLPALLAVNACLFLTPVGLSWFERGQFSLYLAVSYPLLVLGLLRKRWPLVAAAALLAFIKWTSFPPIFVILVVYVLSAKSLAELKANILLVSVFGSVAAALLVLPALFSPGAEAFVRGLLTQEMQDLPKGASLLRYVPRLAVKLLPLAAIALGALNARLNRDLSAWLVPFSAAVVVIMLVYPTRAYEYGLPSVLGFIPLLFAWCREADAEVGVVRQALVGALLLFVLVASFSTRLLPSLFSLVQLYVGVSLAVGLLPVLLGLAQRRRSQPGLPAMQA